MNAPLAASGLAPALLDGLRALIGGRVSTSESDRAQHGRDESRHEPRLPDAVCRPHSTEEVAAIVKLCVAHDTPIVAYGAGSSLEGALIPVKGGISLDMNEMNAILEVRPQGGYYWDTKHGKVVSFLKIAAGALTGKTLDDSIEGHVNP